MEESGYTSSSRPALRGKAERRRPGWGCQSSQEGLGISGAALRSAWLEPWSQSPEEAAGRGLLSGVTEPGGGAGRGLPGRRLGLGGGACRRLPAEARICGTRTWLRPASCSPPRSGRLSRVALRLRGPRPFPARWISVPWGLIERPLPPGRPVGPKASRPPRTVGCAGGPSGRAAGGGQGFEPLPRLVPLIAGRRDHTARGSPAAKPGPWNPLAPRTDPWHRPGLRSPLAAAPGRVLTALRRQRGGTVEDCPAAGREKLGQRERRGLHLGSPCRSLSRGGTQ
ncbi:hypothetical protein P7K49_015207 [Saguinus oedipus]|uniref:Uncharacterized protein n=1 Tax=Saguinus oedipus TaxID=9490 RepID=A0ABQ9V8M2_SAGOE|nr:hypothetical protein P7K49_015207 [Saguinus oedipus]